MTYEFWIGYLFGIFTMLWLMLVAGTITLWFSVRSSTG